MGQIGEHRFRPCKIIPDKERVPGRISQDSRPHFRAPPSSTCDAEEDAAEGRPAPPAFPQIVNNVDGREGPEH